MVDSQNLLSCVSAGPDFLSAVPRNRHAQKYHHSSIIEPLAWTLYQKE